MRWIDVRSDTVTHPTPAMRDAMARAEVGDDVYGDDPTVIELESRVAARLGKEAALFVPSGTFGNQLALFTHCRRGDEVVLGDDCHIVWHEGGAAAVIAGVNLRTVASEQGVLDPAAVAARLRCTDDIHEPKTGLVCLENAHSNGRVIPLDNMAAIAAHAHALGVPVHLDGARLFNAATTLGVEAKQVAAHADSVMICLSKGLAAPVGSMLAGSRDFITAARRKRKLMGGGLRQVGILAAAGLIALDSMTQRLDQDHANARRLAARLDALPGISVMRGQLDINMVWCRLAPEVDTVALMAALTAHGIRANPPEHGMMRFVTHWQITEEDVAKLATAAESGLTA